MRRHKRSGHMIADSDLSSAELESGNALGAFRQTRAPALDKISGPPGARFYPVLGWGLATSHRENAILPAPALDKNLENPNSLNKEVRLFFLGVNSIWCFSSVSSPGDYSICCDHSISSIWVHCPQILL